MAFVASQLSAGKRLAQLEKQIKDEPIQAVAIMKCIHRGSRLAQSRK
jgi:hypothetical protein